MIVICQDIDGGATEADGGASAPVGPSVATPLGLSAMTKTFCLKQLEAAETPATLLNL